MASADFTRELMKARVNLLGFIYSLVRDFNLAEDLFQEVSIRLLEREDQFVPGSDFGAWARAFARNVVHEQARSRSRLVISQEAVEAAAEHFASPEPAAPQAQREALQSCLRQLDEQPRRLISLRFEQGLSMEEIGRAVNRSAGAVQVALSRTRSWLMKCIEQRTAEEA
jgi:RNA polymerase sigma-70 factor, ECF subfamily